MPPYAQYTCTTVYSKLNMKLFGSLCEVLDLLVGLCVITFYFSEVYVWYMGISKLHVRNMGILKVTCFNMCFGNNTCQSPDIETSL